MKYKYLVWLDLPGFAIGGMQKSILISKHYFRPCAVIYKMIACLLLNMCNKNRNFNYYSFIKITKR